MQIFYRNIGTVGQQINNKKFPQSKQKVKVDGYWQHHTFTYQVPGTATTVQNLFQCSRVSRTIVSILKSLLTMWRITARS